MTFSGFRASNPYGGESREQEGYQKNTAQGAGNAGHSDCLDAWLEDYVAIKCKETTREGYSKRIEEYIRPALGKYLLAAIKAEHIQKFINSMYYKRYSRNTLSNLLSIIISSMRYAKRREWILFSPAEDIDLPGTRECKHNLQGDIVAILDSNGTAVVKYKYDAWGKPINKTGSMASTLGLVQPFRYRGYVYDDETELYYLPCRYYSPIKSRFINGDTMLGKCGSLLAHNAFSYCRNKTINRKDSDGCDDTSAVADVFPFESTVVYVFVNPIQYTSKTYMYQTTEYYIFMPYDDIQYYIRHLYYSDNDFEELLSSAAQDTMNSVVENVAEKLLEAQKLADDMPAFSFATNLISFFVFGRDLIDTAKKTRWKKDLEKADNAALIEGTGIVIKITETYSSAYRFSNADFCTRWRTFRDIDFEHYEYKQFMKHIQE